MSSYIRIVATHFSLETWFVSGKISVDTLHIGNTEDNNTNNNNNNNNNNSCCFVIIEK
jgi:hypothetical protein